MVAIADIVEKVPLALRCESGRNAMLYLALEGATRSILIQGPRRTWN